MNSFTVRKAFLDFFESKQHKIVPSAPMVVKNDPTLMFTNAGMNQFKDIFLGNSPIKFPRIANSQKCLRVSGKHNDLEEVGHDTYHHTMFEMLGNWSFGDYFKKEAIEWAWELLTDVLKIEKDRLYVSVFKGNENDKIPMDKEAWDLWSKIVPEEKIVLGSKKDNFWEMGDTGPCGPCSEIHIDLRDNEDRKNIPGKDLVNKDNPLVIEIWNLVFIEFNRQANGSLVKLPAQHVDTGMGFERLNMVLQGKKSNYDTDVFQPLIQHIALISGIKYGDNQKSDIAMRVISDHLRTISFAIADGQLPTNNKAGYVIRRILRRAVRYGFTFLNFKEPFICELVPVLVQNMGEVYPEIKIQMELIQKVVREEEMAFLRTLSKGIQKFENYISELEKGKTIDGIFAFELFDTYGFPIDLTQLMAREKGLSVDMDGFNKGMEEQKNRSRQAATIDTEDWVVVNKEIETEFVGYNFLSSEIKIIKYRKIKNKDKQFYQLVFDKTPFYGESGGQAGDKGYIESINEKIEIVNTLKENNLIVHIVNILPENVSSLFNAKVDIIKRTLTANNHSATHLLHSALRQVIGKHIEQKGSFVNEERLRFDFSHFSKLTDEEIFKVETLVNKKIRENISLEEHRNIAVDKAKEMGAMALFGEKYGDFVRVITFENGFSTELCGGTHVPMTGQIGMFKIISETAIAAGVRRIEAITADKAEEYFANQSNTIDELTSLLKNPKDIVKAVTNLIDENGILQKQISDLNHEKALGYKDELIKKIQKINGINFISETLKLDTNAVKDLAYNLKNSVDNLFLVIGSESDGKANLSIMISENLVSERNLNASTIVRELAKEINGGGGGQAFYATAGGKNPEGIKNALEKAKTYVK